MKKIILIIIFLTLSSVILTGCFSTEQRRFPQRGGFQGMSDRAMNISEEERQQMFEERQKQGIEACQGKNEDDSCQFEGPMGGIEGTCKIMDENLVCTTDRPMRQR